MVQQWTQRAVDRIVGTSFALGLSVALLRWAARRRSHRSSAGVGRGWIRSAFSILALRRHLGDGVGDDDENDDDGTEWVKHVGSCHCGSVVFTLRGPRRLRPRPSSTPGVEKIRYPRVFAVADRFRLLRGSREVRFYRVDRETPRDGDCDGGDDDNDNDEFSLSGAPLDRGRRPSGAHAFCGNCGVHILRMPSQDSDALEINARCLDVGKEDDDDKAQRLRSDGAIRGESVRGGNFRRGRSSFTSPLSPSTSSLSWEGENDVAAAAADGEIPLLPPAAALSSTTATVSENEPFLDGGRRQRQDQHSLEKQGEHDFFRDLRGRQQQQRRVRRSSPRPPCLSREGFPDAAPTGSAAPGARAESLSGAAATDETGGSNGALPWSRTTSASAGADEIAGGDEDDEFSSIASSSRLGSMPSLPTTREGGAPALFFPRTTNGALPRLHPRPGASSDGSVRTLPSRWEMGGGGATGRRSNIPRSGSIGGESSVTSLGSNNSESVAAASTAKSVSAVDKMLSVSRMKHYMSRHMNSSSAGSGPGDGTSVRGGRDGKDYQRKVQKRSDEKEL